MQKEKKRNARTVPNIFLGEFCDICSDGSWDVQRLCFNYRCYRAANEVEDYHEGFCF